MIHELIDPKKKTNKATASRNTRSFLDSKPCSDHLNFDPSDCENKEVDSSVTFIPPWLRNSLGLSQRHNQSHLAVGHSEQKPAKIIHRFKEPAQNEFDDLKANEDDDCCKNVHSQFGTLPAHCPQEENATQNAIQERPEIGVITPSDRVHWQLMSKESDTDSSCLNAETRCFEKIDPKITNSDLMTFAEIGKIRDEEKKKLKFIRQKSKSRRRNVSEHKAFEQSRTDADCMAEPKGKDEVSSCPKKNVHTVPSEIRDLETKFLLLGKCQGSNSPRLNQLELRLLQDMKEQVGSIGDFDLLLDQKKNNSRDVVRDPDFFANGVGDKKMDDAVLQKFNSDLKPDADKDSMLSTDDENDIKRFSEFLSKNKNAEEKRKCLEEVRNYFEKKRKSRLSKKRYLEDLKTKLSPESERKEVHKDRLKCRELTMILPNRGKRSKFALCDEEVVERAVDETLQKFVELYHFHVSPRVMGNMKKNILQAMQSDSMESCASKMNLEEDKSPGKKIRNSGLAPPKPQSPKRELQYNHPRHVGLPEIIDDESSVQKESKKKTFKTLIVSSNDHLVNQSKEIDVVDNERLKRLNKEFEVFLRSIQSHVDVSNLKIQSIILEKEEANSAKHVQFVYNFTKKSLETEKQVQGQPFREGQEMKSFKEIGVQASLKKEAAKKSVRVQAMEYQETSEQSLQTDEKKCVAQCTQTEASNVTFRELKELKSFDINPGLYRMVKSKEAGKFYLYPEQPDGSKEQSYSKSDSSVLKDRKARKKELVNIIGKERSKERRVFLREKERAKLKKNKKVTYTSSYLKAAPFRREKEMKKKSSDSRDRDAAKTESSINCLYFRNAEEKTAEPQPFEKKPSAEENPPETAEKLGVGDAREEHLGCVWLWNGEKISPGCDLKTHVENLLKEKLREITEVDVLQKNLLVNDLGMQKSETLAGQKNMYAKDLSLSRTDTEVLQGATCESQKNFDINKSNPVFCYTSYSNVNTERDSRVQFTSENDLPEAVEKPDSKKLEETNEVKSSRLSIFQDKIVRNVGTQNSQQRFLSINLAKTRTQSKTTIAVTKKKESKRTSSVKPIPRRLVSFKKAEEIIRAVEEIKKLEMELKSGRNESRESDSMLDASSSSFSFKNEPEKPLSLVLGLREGPSRTEGTSSCTVKSRLRKVMDLVNHEVQTGAQEVQAGSRDDLEDANSEINLNLEQPPGRHLELIENFLCRVSQKERENLWNDVRQFIKTKIGRDINDDGAKEVCIEIEQDVPKHEHGTVRQAVLARGHYVRNEGDVEVEIDLTLEDLEKILRQRQKRIRKQSLQRKKYKRFISSSSVQSELNKEEMRKYQKYLNRVAALGEGLMAENPSGSLKKNKGN